MLFQQITNMYIALWFEEVLVSNPYYEVRGYSGEPAQITETREHFAMLNSLEELQKFVIKHQDKKTLKFFKAEEIKPKISITVEVTV